MAPSLLLRILFAALSVTTVLVLSAFAGMPLTDAGAPRQLVERGLSLDWRLTLIDSVGGLGMKSSKTRDGNGTVSFGELRDRKTIPDAAWKLYRAALVEDGRRHYSESLRLAMSATTRWPAFPEAQTALAIWHLRNLDLVTCERATRIALDVDSGYLPAQEVLGIVFLMRGELTEARSTFESVVGTDPTRDLAQYFLAETLVESGDFTLAAGHFETATRLRRHPPKPVVEWDSSSFGTLE